MLLSTESKLPSVNLPSTAGKTPSEEGKLTYGDLPSVESKIHPTEGVIFPLTIYPLYGEF